MPTKYTQEVLQDAVNNSQSISDVVRYLGMPLAGGTHAHISRSIKRLGIDTSHFRTSAWNAGKSFPAKQKSPEEILVLRQEGREAAYLLRRALTEVGVEYRCGECGLLPEWNGRSLTLQVDHLDSNFLDCRVGNLRFLCPNCHTQTPSYARGSTQRTPNICKCGKEIYRRSKTCRSCRPAPVPKKNNE